MHVTILFLMKAHKEKELAQSCLVSWAMQLGRQIWLRRMGRLRKMAAVTGDSR